MSGSELSFFSLNPKQISDLKEKPTRISKILIRILATPQRLLATILIGNYFVNIGIIVLSTFIINSLFDFSSAPTLGIIIQVALITFLLLLFGEILPKVYASRAPLFFATRVVYPIYLLIKLLKPISASLIYFTSLFNKYFTPKKKNISIDELSDAFDLTTNESDADNKLLKGIVGFGSIDVRSIMKARVDIVAMDINAQFDELLTTIREARYSRIPVYRESFDKVKGILYVKDLLPYLHENPSFNWQTLIRSPYFVPEAKKIDDLLHEFQAKKIHMAIVIDEYGGMSGLVTLEDIMEEIVGEISDEFDDDEPVYQKLDDKNFIFDGKTLLNDFFKIVSINDDTFSEIRGEADTLAGLILEIKGEMPFQSEIIQHENIVFKIELVDKRRIQRIKVTLMDNEATNNE